MPRIKKQGLDYFPVNTDFIHDRLVRRIMKREGDASLSVLIEVLSYIYAGEGYYVSADSLFYEDLSSNLYEKNCDDVKRIVALAVEYGVFDAALFQKYSILTSADIQRQYLFSTRRRNSSQLEPAYCLIADELTQKASKDKKPKTVKSVNGATGGASANPSAGAGLEPKDTNVDRAENAAFIPENVTSGTHSIAQHSIAQQSTEEHSVAEQRKDSPSSSPLGSEAVESGKEEGRSEGNSSEMSASDLPVGKRREWTLADIDRLQPPTDGVKRNYDGLLYSMRLFSIPPSEQYAIIRKSNFGAIGGPVWKGFCTLRDSCGKIKLPGRYLLSVMNK